MVYCEKCGAQNPDDSQFCNQCGGSLYKAAVRESQSTDCFGPRDRAEDECFGLPYGGAIFGLLIGAIIILAGLATIFGWSWSFLWDEYIFAGVLIVIGILFVLGAIFAITRRR